MINKIGMEWQASSALAWAGGSTASIDTMKSATLALVLLALGVSTASVQAIDNGFYRLSDKPTPVSMMTLDGLKVYLGDKVPDALKEGGTIISDGNDNSSYMFQIFRNASSLGDEGKLVLVLNDQCSRFWGVGGDATHCNLEGSASDPNFIEQLAILMKTTPKMRHHPGHQFTARFVVNSDGYALGSPVVVKLEITNCGTQTFSIPSNSYSGLDGDPFTFTATRRAADQNNVENLPRLPSLGGPSNLILLKPHETHSVSVDLTKYLKLDQVGSYGIRGSYAFQVIGDPHHFDILWDDFATAEFMIRIK